ncbi:hypothetical protein [uncultured Vibrio sp.]|nr:hypothetical protein [uncultured Vibrio sp.]
MVKAQKLIPFFDMTYQGYGEGIAEDAYVVEKHNY